MAYVKLLVLSVSYDPEIKPVASFQKETKKLVVIEFSQYTQEMYKRMLNVSENFCMLSDNFSSRLRSCKRWNETARLKAQIRDNFWN